MRSSARLVYPLRLLFLTLSDIESISEHGIYTDLMREFRDRGDDVYIVCPSQRRSRRPTELTTKDGVTILRVRTGNITKANIIEKTISTISIQHQFTSAIRVYFGEIRFDLVLYATPPVTFERVVDDVKRRCGCTSYLLLKDIFPQNAVDLAMIRQSSLVWHYFRGKEKRLYALSDYIGCMSPANVKYLLAHNPDIPETRLEVCPNSIDPRPVHDSTENRAHVKGDWGIPQDSMLLVFGGNLGKPQGLDFLLEVLDGSEGRNDVFFMIVGSGTEYDRIDAHLRNGQHENARLLRALPKDRYDELLTVCDVGLIFLDPRFTIPNFPSRLTAYMEAGLPIIAATDVNTDIKDVLRESGSGIWVENGNLDGFMAAMGRLSGDAKLRREMGRRGRAYLEEYYTVSRAYEIITAHLRNADSVGSAGHKQVSAVNVSGSGVNSAAGCGGH